MELMSNYGKIDLLWFDGEWLALGGMEKEAGTGKMTGRPVNI